jgi:hypothetical protein
MLDARYPISQDLTSLNWMLDGCRFYSPFLLYTLVPFILFQFRGIRSQFG